MENHFPLCFIDLPSKGKYHGKKKEGRQEGGQEEETQLV